MEDTLVTQDSGAVLHGVNGNGTGRPRRLRIGEVSERTGLTARTIRYYEEIGLLVDGRDARAGKGRHRTFDEDDIRHLLRLVRLRELLGLSLEELRDLAPDGPESASDSMQVGAALRLLDRQLELVRQRAAEIADLQHELTQRRKTLRRSLRDEQAASA